MPSVETPSGGEPIHFRGGPHSLVAVFRAPLEQEPEVTIRPGEKAQPISAPVFFDDDPRILRVSVPREFNAGTYDGSVVVGGEVQQALFHIAPDEELRMYPESVHLEVEAGGKVRSSFHLLNRGNVPVDVPKVLAFGVFCDGGIERALRKAYSGQLDEGERRVDRLFDRLAASHGGLVKAKVLEGEGRHEPNALVELELEFVLSDELEAGRVYRGNLELRGLVYPLEFSVLVDGGKASKGKRKNE